MFKPSQNTRNIISLMLPFSRSFISYVNALNRSIQVLRNYQKVHFLTNCVVLSEISKTIDSMNIRLFPPRRHFSFFGFASLSWMLVWTINSRNLDISCFFELTESFAGASIFFKIECLTVASQMKPEMTSISLEVVFPIVEFSYILYFLKVIALNF